VGLKIGDFSSYFFLEIITTASIGESFSLKQEKKPKINTVQCCVWLFGRLQLTQIELWFNVW
jgi:hypothetical protein